MSTMFVPRSIVCVDIVDLRMSQEEYDMQRKWAEDADSECQPTASLLPWSWNQYACGL